MIMMLLIRLVLSLTSPCDQHMEDEAVQLDGVIIVFLRYKSVNLSHSTVCVVMFVV